MPHAQTLTLMRQMEAVLASVGVSSDPAVRALSSTSATAACSAAHARTTSGSVTRATRPDAELQQALVAPPLPQPEDLDEGEVLVGQPLLPAPVGHPADSAAGHHAATTMNADGAGDERDQRPQRRPATTADRAAG